MAPEYTDYAPLPIRNEEGLDRDNDWVSQTRVKSTWMLHSILTLSLVLNASFVLYQLSSPADVSDTQVLYSPAQDVLRYKNIVFDSSFGAMKTMYQGPPSNVNNDLWSELYNLFHQLHCLNQVRKGLYGEVDWTDEDDHTGITHLDHCVDIIRQNLMKRGKRFIRASKLTSSVQCGHNPADMDTGLA
ncbi:hypothetical protein P170DRAFT_421695 [Aspergillus steynii IBT 23096]|uniref:Tat pathway signal sequence n=1 Tax=Aspergillus steynii IBT 23096 TaxID=1392250 RepID=A0A2I2GQC4_9EURO|nr:uncharacterized protein P170DRAFT_421695 [Aspergillus steynii IBT 23096]PLB55082.1 hypothetical protein P170DRAFT_421695 [Aspergillus steynii IBT 23096]